MSATRKVRIAGPALWVAVTLSGCAPPEQAAPRCDDQPRLGIVAQALPEAAFVPCVATVPPGWEIASFSVRRGSATFELRSDQAREPVRVRFHADCDTSGATAVSPRHEGVRTFVDVARITPRYAGRFTDVFPGGCVTYTFDFARGPHIALTDELRMAVDLYPRRDLRQHLREELGITLD